MALTVREYLTADGKNPAKDITRAKEFWRDYLETKRHGKTT